MAAKKSAHNPFYLLLVITGIVFVATAFAFFTMTVREAGGAAASQHGLTAFVARYGLQMLVGELVLLGVATFGAMATDEYWQRKSSGRPRDVPPPSNSANGSN